MLHSRHHLLEHRKDTRVVIEASSYRTSPRHRLLRTAVYLRRTIDAHRARKVLDTRYCPRRASCYDPSFHLALCEQEKKKKPPVFSALSGLPCLNSGTRRRRGRRLTNVSIHTRKERRGVPLFLNPKRRGDDGRIA